MMLGLLACLLLAAHVLCADIRAVKIAPTVSVQRIKTTADTEQILMHAEQIINNIALEEFDTDISKYTATLKEVIAACMDGVEPEDIVNIVITSITGTATEADGAHRALQESETDAIMAAYDVQSDDTTLSFEGLSEQLIEMVTSGEFDTILQETATTNGATDLEDASSSSVSTSSSTTDTVLMFVEQIINNIALSEFDTDVSKYTATLKEVIAACMDGVAPEDIINMVITSVTQSGQRTLQEGETDAIAASYEVLVTGQDTSYDTLAEELTTAVADGEFDTLMASTATENGATALEDATSDSVTTTPSTESQILFYAVQIINNIALEEFNVDVSKYTATLQEVIAACMEGVEPEDIVNIVVTSFTSTGERVTGQRSLQEDPVEAIEVSYLVQTDDPSLESETLVEELVTAVQTGSFDTILAETASQDGTTALEDATSDGVSTQDLMPVEESAPTAAPTPSPEDLVLMLVEQVINHVVMEEFNVDVSKYTATLKEAIAACMDGVAPEDIINMVISSVTSSGERVTGQRALQEGDDDTITVAYEVQANGEDLSYAGLSEELTTAVASGEFDTVLQTTATENGAVGLDEATSDTVTTQPASEDLVLFYVEQIINNIALEEFNVDVSKYTATLKEVIAACMDGVEPEDIIQMVVTSVTSSGERVTGQRSLQEDPTDAIAVSYEVQVDSPDASFESLSSQLVEAVESGEFTSILEDTATDNEAVALEDATSDTITVQDLLPEPPGDPTAAPSAAPTSDKTEKILFYVEQIINDIALNEFDTDVSKYTATLKEVIAACMDGATPEDIIELVVTAVIPQSAVASELRGAAITVQSTSNSSILASYKVSLDSDSETFESLSSELEAAVESGQFDTYMTEFATANGADYLVGTTAGSITIVNLLLPADDDDDRLSGGAIAGIVLGVLFGVGAIVAAVAYYYHHKQTSAALKTALLTPAVAVPAGGGSRYYGKDTAKSAGTANPITGEL